jgi:hypothetical protein
MKKPNDFPRLFKTQFPPEKLDLIVRPEHFRSREVRGRIVDASSGDLTEGLGANLPPAFQKGQEDAYPSNDRDWDRLYRHMDWLGLNILRYWFIGEAVIPERGTFRKDHLYIERLVRFHDWAVRKNARLILDFGVVPSWLRFRTKASQPPDTAAPSDPDAYIELYAMPIIRHLIRDLGLSRIRYLCLFNEPFNPDFTDFSFYTPEGTDPFAHYAALHGKMRKRLDAEGIPDKELGLIGPNSHDLFVQPLIEMEKRGLDWAESLSAVDEHAYRMRFDTLPECGHMPTLTIGETLSRYLKPAVAQANRHGKPYLLTEYSCFYYGGITGDPEGPSRHESALTEAEFIVRAMGAGAGGGLKWSLINSGRNDGKWQYIETADGSYEPVPAVYFMNAVLTRYLPRKARIHPLRFEGAGTGFVHGTAFRYPEDLTVLVINDHPCEKFVLSLEDARSPGKETAAWQTDPLRKHRRIPVESKGGLLRLELPAMSLTAVTTFRLDAEEDGLIAI